MTGDGSAGLLVVLGVVALVVGWFVLQDRRRAKESAKRSVSAPWVREQLGGIGLVPVEVTGARARFRVSRLHLPVDVAEQVAAALGWASCEIERTGDRLVATRSG